MENIKKKFHYLVNKKPMKNPDSIKGSRHRYSLCSEQCEQSGLGKIKIKANCTHCIVLCHNPKELHQSHHGKSLKSQL